MVRQMVQAVAQCHAKGVILRDVKPENFLFRTSAETAPLKMVDFGLATHCTPDQVMTER
jgi:calcium-dependent protein kinase